MKNILIFFISAILSFFVYIWSYVIVGIALLLNATINSNPYVWYELILLIFGIWCVSMVAIMLWMIVMFTIAYKKDNCKIPYFKYMDKAFENIVDTLAKE